MIAEQTKQDLEKEFYSKRFNMSYSGLNKILYSPNLFYKHYVLQQREEKVESYLIDGKVIHCLLLDDGSFDKQFIVMPGTIPTGNSKLLVDKLYNRVRNNPMNFEDHKTIIQDILKEINLYQSLVDDKKPDKTGVQKTGNDKRLEKIITDSNKEYFEFLKIKDNKDIVDQETLTRCNEAVAILRAHNGVSELLGLLTTGMENVDVYNEIKLENGALNHPFGLKGILDNIKVDHDKKIIYINDLKTTGKTIADFQETIKFYNYSLQAAIYIRLANEKFHELLLSGYDLIFNFVVIDKYNQVYCFEVSPGTMLEWQLILDRKLMEAEWHYTNKDYSLPYSFCTGKVLL